MAMGGNSLGLSIMSVSKSPSSSVVIVPMLSSPSSPCFLGLSQSVAAASRAVRKSAAGTRARLCLAFGTVTASCPSRRQENTRNSLNQRLREGTGGPYQFKRAGVAPRITRTTKATAT